MGATEKGGKKSRRLFSSLRPWKATRRLWRTRSAPKAAQGECGRGRGTCYCARPAPGSDCGISGRVLRPRDPRAGVARPGGPAQRGRPCILTLGHGKKSSSRASLGSLLQTQGPASAQSPLFPPLGPHKRLPLALVVAALFPRKSPCLLVWLWTEGVQGASGTQSYSDLHSPPQHLAGTCNAAPIREMNRNPLLPPHRTLPLSNLFGVVPCYLLNLAKNYFPNTFPPCPHQGLN